MATVNGTGNSDTINAAFGTTAGNDLIFAFGGDDGITGSGGNDFIDGGQGFDVLDYTGTADRIVINAVFGSMRQLNGTTVVKTDTFTNIEEWRTGTGDDVLTGAGIDEQFRPGLGRDFVNGGGGFDGILYTDASARVFVDLVRGFAIDHGGFRDTLVSIEYARGGNSNDVIRASADHGLLRGGLGNDSLISTWNGISVTNGGISVDYNERLAGAPVTVDLAAGFAQIGAERDTLIGNFFGARGGAGADTLLGNDFNNAFRPRNGADVIDGRGGFDRADYRDESAGITASMATVNSGTVIGADGTTDTLTSIEWVRGSNHNDVLSSHGAFITPFGAYGFAAGDTPQVEGWIGNDTLGGTAGRAVIARYVNDPGPIFADMAAGFVIDGWGGVDTLTNIWGIRGTSFDDMITLGAGNEWVRGDDGDDVLDGGAGIDRVSFDDAPGAVVVDLALGTAQDGWGNIDTLTGFEVVTGTAFNDQLLGDANNNWFLPGLGADIVDGRGGNDTVVYFFATNAVFVDLGGNTATGTGNDQLISIEGAIGSAFDDELRGSSGSNQLYGYLGNDLFLADAGDDLLDGGDGIDTLAYAGGISLNVNLSLAVVQNTVAAGFDTILNIENVTGGGGNDSLTGNGLANVLRGQGGNDGLFGVDGDDTLEGGVGNDILQGGAGTDTAVFSDPAGVNVSLLLQGFFQVISAALGSDFLNGIENLTGSVGNDTLTGNALANVLDGGAGDDTLNGGDGADTIQGGLGDDTLVGGLGDDAVSYANAGGNVLVSLLLQGGLQFTGATGFDTLTGFERVIGGAFNDILIGDAANNTLIGGAGDDILEGGIGNDALIGGDGIDLASYGAAFAPVTVYLNASSTTGPVGTDFFTSIEGFIGSAFNDTLVGNTSDNVLKGGDGADRLYGLGGNDTFEGGAGFDQYFGDSGIDTVDFSSANAVARAVLGTAGFVDTISFGLDQFNSIENLIGGSAGDFFTGDAVANVLDGRGGNDIMVGGAGDDRLLGGADSDSLTGGLGADVIHLGTGFDIVRYGAAAESQVASLDRIINFTQSGGDGFDRIGLENAAGALFGGVTPTSIVLGSRLSIEAASELSDLAAQISGLAASTASALSVTQVDVAFGGVAGRYVVVNDTVAGFNAATDMLIAIEMAPGSTTNLTAANFFLF